MSKISYIITDQNVTVNYDGQTHVISRNEKLADQLIQALREKRNEEIPNLVSAAKRVENFGKGNFVVKDGRVLINGETAPEVLSQKIIRFCDENLPYEPLLHFAENLLKNPSFRAVNELYQFLEKNDHPITDEGMLIAYKAVRQDWTDFHTGTFDNHPGQILEMPRNKVDEDSNSHCSHGFHVGNWRYCNDFHSGEGRMLEVEVNPADVVSIPNDLNEKIRVCKYKVLKEVDVENSSLLWKSDDKLEEKIFPQDAYCDQCDSLLDKDEPVCAKCYNEQYCPLCGEYKDEMDDVCYECDLQICSVCGRDRDIDAISDLCNNCSDLGFENKVDEF